MGVGYGIKSNGDSLIFAIDAASQQNLTDKGFNRLSNGAFVNGADATPSGGHNAQNDIVQFENPGDSTYVLRQTMGIAQTEYQCNPTIPSGTSTPICMSGWYAQSLDYNASSRMFHSRAYSSGGSHTSLGTGIGTQIGEPVNINGISWTHRYTILNSPSDATGTFNWYVGYGGDSYTGARYYTNLKVQDGRSPCPNDICGNYHVSRNYATYNSANKAWDFNGTDAYMDTTGFTPQTIPNCTIEALVYDTKASGYRAIVQHNVAGDDALYINPNNYLMWWPATASTLTVPSNQWVYVAASHQAGVGITYCVNGVTQFVSGNFADPQDWDFIRIGGHSTGDGERWKGQIRMARIHNRNLSADELKQNYHAVKNRT
jgi:hypothetical protein